MHRSDDAVERVEHVVPDPAEEHAVAGQPESSSLALELGLGHAGAGDDEADAAAARARSGRARRARGGSPSRRRGGRPAGRAARRAPAYSARSALEDRRRDRLEVAGIDAVGDRGDLRGPHAEHVRHVAAHVARAGDHVVGAGAPSRARRRGCGTAGGSGPSPGGGRTRWRGRRRARPTDLPRDELRGAGHEPVVRVDEIELERARTAPPRARACGRSSRRPSARTRSRPWGTGIPGSPDAVDDHAVAVGLGRQAAAAARQHVHLDAVASELLGQLADVASEPALDHRRVLPGDQQDTHPPVGTLPTCRRASGHRRAAPTTTSTPSCRSTSGSRARLGVNARRSKDAAPIATVRTHVAPTAPSPRSTSRQLPRPRPPPACPPARDGHEHIAAAHERARRRPGVERLVGAGERLGPSRAQPEQRSVTNSLRGLAVRRCCRPSAGAASPGASPKSTGRRLSGSTSARNASSSPW